MTTAITYEISNPSDCYTMVASDRAVAAVAVVLLGNGAYGLRVLEGAEQSEGVPILAFNGSGALEWFTETFGESFDTLYERHRADIAIALASVLIGGLPDRRTFDDGLALITDETNRRTWHERWHDSRRSSMNDIGRRALDLAAGIREDLQAPVSA